MKVSRNSKSRERSLKTLSTQDSLGTDLKSCETSKPSKTSSTFHKSKSKEECPTQKSIMNNEKETVVIHKDVSPRLIRNEKYELRQNKFEKDLEEYYVKSVSYRSDTARYQCKYVEPTVLIMKYGFPSFLMLSILFAHVCIVAYMSAMTLKESKTILEVISDITFVKYVSFGIVNSTSEFISNIKEEYKKYECPGFVQGAFEDMDESEFALMKLEYPNLKNAMIAESYRWVNPTDHKLGNTIKCPPSLIIELEK